jgi:hypothetical protein
LDASNGEIPNQPVVNRITDQDRTPIDKKSFWKASDDEIPNQPVVNRITDQGRTPIDKKSFWKASDGEIPNHNRVSSGQPTHVKQIKLKIIKIKQRQNKC